MRHGDSERCSPNSAKAPRRGRGLFLACAAGLLAPASVTVADDGVFTYTPTIAGTAQPADPTADRSTRWSLTADYWFASLDGDFALRRTPSPAPATATHIEDDAGPGFHLRADGVFNRFVFFLDGSGASGKQRRNFGGVGPAFSGEMNVDLLWFEFGLGYRLAETATPGVGGGVSPPRFALDALLGGRLTSMDASFQRTGSAEIKADNLWIEPYVGAQLSWRPAPNLAVRLGGDVGGFGVGSQFSWQASGTIGYSFHVGGLTMNVHGGYRALSQNFDTDQGDDLSGWDGIVHGPIAGLTVEF